MCTLSWIVEPDEYRIFFNRDEKRTRLPARPPEEIEVDGVHVLTPIDGNAGGTWLAVNEYGVTAAILNNYEADARMPSTEMLHKSRGKLVMNLMSSHSREEAFHRIGSLKASDYRPFFLAVFDLEGPPVWAKWNGLRLERLSLTNGMRPVTTSSYDTRAVLSARRRKYRELVEKHGGVDEDVLRAFHRSRDERGGAYSVTMTRDDAQTVSYSEVTVGREMVSFFYRPRELALDDPPYVRGETYQIDRA